MDLYVLRHAIAADRDAQDYPDDADRPLTGAGRSKLRGVVRGMRTLGLSFDRILTSPFLRARQTAEIVAKGLGVETQVETTRHLAPDGSLRALIDLIAASGETEASVLVVGHEPALSGVISLLVAGDDRVAVTLKKAGLCKLVSPRLAYGQCATLEWLLTPSQAQRIR